jgi:hypothetical protein
MGHSLAASGAIEAVVSAIAVFEDFLPANTGWQKLDLALGLTPLTQPLSQPVTAVLSNSFGFGGNNGCLVITKADSVASSPAPRGPRAGLAVHGWSCVTGVGNSAASMSQLSQGLPVAGMADLDRISENLPPRLVRRLKRLPRMTLSLAAAALADSGLEEKPSSVFIGTGWGALSETYDFLTRLAESQEQFPSPTDFVGSVHNGPAGQAAIMFGATGANITSSGGDYSFEQALLAAELMMKEGDERSLVLGVDEGHQMLSPLLDPSIAPETDLADLADGGGGLCLSRKREGARCLVRVPFYQSSATKGAIDLLIEALGGVKILKGRYALVLAGIPAAVRDEGEAQLALFIEKSGCQAPVIRYRELTGEFASASAVAAVMAVSFLTERQLPAGKEDGKNAILVLGLGPYLSAMEFSRP